MGSKRRPKKPDSTPHPNPPIFCRLPAEMVARLDAAAEKFSLEGIPRRVSRSDVIRKFLCDGLANLTKGTPT